MNEEVFRFEEMNKSKSSRSHDRLSELPESIIFHIFWLLPMIDVVRTSVLLKRWRKLWTTTPYLNFDYTQMDGDQDDIRKFVNRVLVSWEGTNIQKFKMDFFYQTEESFFIDIDFWVYFALGKKVRDLYLYADPNIHTDCKVYLVPQYLYSCSWLNVLSLAGCAIAINGNVQWKQLKSLTIGGPHITASAINQILCGSPQLEVLVLELWGIDPQLKDPNWSIRSSSLRSLSIYNHIDLTSLQIHDNVEPGRRWDKALRICTPNLKALKISGIPFKEYLLMDVSSLTHATLDLDFFCYDYGLCYANDLLEAVLRQIFPTIQQVEKLVLSNWCIKVLGDMNKEDLLSSSSNVKFLELNNKYMKYKQMARVLEIFPEVKMLALGGICSYRSGAEQEPDEFDTNLPDSFLQHLRTTQITCRKDEKLMYPLIKLVLKYASKLEKMVLRGVPPSDSLLLVSQELLRMPRSSPAAELIFFEN